MVNEPPQRSGDRSLLIRDLVFLVFSVLGCGLGVGLTYFHKLGADNESKLVFPENIDEPKSTWKIREELANWNLWLSAAVAVVIEYWLPFIASCCCCCKCIGCCFTERRCISKETLGLMIIQLIVAFPVFVLLQLVNTIWIRMPLEFVFLQISYFLFAVIGEKCGLKDPNPSLIFYFYRYGCSYPDQSTDLQSDTQSDDVQIENGRPPPPDDKPSDSPTEETTKSTLIGSAVKLLLSELSEAKSVLPKKTRAELNPDSMEELLPRNTNCKKTPRTPHNSFRASNKHCKEEPA